MQATKGTAHGDFNLIVLAPDSVQEAVDLMIDAFDLAEKYRNPVMLIGDGMIGQMMEPVEFPDVEVGPPLKDNDWALTGCEGRERRLVNSLYLDAEKLNTHNEKLKAKFEEITANEQRWDVYNCDKPFDLLVTGFGMMARICKTAIDHLQEEGINVGLFRPITVKPYPYEALREQMDAAKRVLCVEMNMGQMLLDVQIAGEGTREIDFYGKTGGVIPSVENVVEQIRASLAKSGK
jgi:2-oxoglutarate/2-oxoacid ferredoxin oxidoreductase subunit alpha